MKPENQHTQQSLSDDIVKLLLRRQVELNSLLEIAQGINNNLSIHSLYEMLEFVLTIHLKIGKYAIYYKEHTEWTCVSKLGEANLIDLSVFNSISTYQEAAQKAKELENDEFTLLLPVIYNGMMVSVVMIGDYYPEDEDSKDTDIKFIESIINIIIVAVENKKLQEEQVNTERIKKDLEMAAQVQHMLFPENLPKNEKIHMAASYLPHHSIGGDFYDCIQLSDKEYLYCIADVSGKGIGAALIMANFQANLRLLAEMNTSLDKMIRTLNRVIFTNTKGEKFITVFLGRYNTETKKLNFVNAGHNPPLFIAGNELKELKDGTMLLGIMDELPFLNQGEVNLTSGSLILHYTDGLIEMDDTYANIFEENDLKDFVRKNHTLSATEFNSLLLTTILSIRKKNYYDDDITILTLQTV